MREQYKYRVFIKNIAKKKPHILFYLIFLKLGNNLIKKIDYT